MSGRPFAELRDTGLLWLINRVVFHPRGYALGLHFDLDLNCIGWSLLGDGSEPWSMGPDPTDDERKLLDAKPEVELFALVKALLS